MIRVKKISQEQLLPLIEKAFQGDIELFEKYHEYPCGEQECILAVFEKIKGLKGVEKPSYYTVLLGDKAIGFFVVSYKRLYSFGIALKFRRKDILKKWWELLKKIVGKEFICSLYKNNTRAIAFLLRQGMQIGEIRNNIVTLIHY